VNLEANFLHIVTSDHHPFPHCADQKDRYVNPQWIGRAKLLTLT